MAHRPGPGRRSKGPRRQLQTHIAPKALVDSVTTHARKVGLPVGQTIADLLALHLDMPDEVLSPLMLNYAPSEKPARVAQSAGKTATLQTRVTERVFAAIDAITIERYGVGGGNRASVLISLLADALGQPSLAGNNPNDQESEQLALTG
jgi:hypothetical protein